MNMARLCFLAMDGLCGWGFLHVVKKEILGTGEGASKKEAIVEAAKHAYNNIKKQGHKD